MPPSFDSGTDAKRHFATPRSSKCHPTELERAGSSLPAFQASQHRKVPWRVPSHSGAGGRSKHTHIGKTVTCPEAVREAAQALREMTALLISGICNQNGNRRWEVGTLAMAGSSSLSQPNTTRAATGKGPGLSKPCCACASAPCSELGLSSDAHRLPLDKKRGLLRARIPAQSRATSRTGRALQSPLSRTPPGARVAGEAWHARRKQSPRPRKAFRRIRGSAGKTQDLPQEEPAAPRQSH